MHIDTRPHTLDDLHAQDHDLAGEPADRLEYLADAHAVPTSLSCVNSKAT
jgi:hypothetical protein